MKRAPSARIRIFPSLELAVERPTVGEAVDGSLKAFLGHFRFEIPRFFRFRVGVLGGAEGADGVVGTRWRPEVGATRPKCPMEGVFATRNVRAHFLELLPT